jgi:serine/threonine protein phosphatase PrpC
MRFISAAHTDVGIRKDNNQDSCLLIEAQASDGPLCLAVLADGMGGLAKGELASATICQAFRDWFRHGLPLLMQDKAPAEPVEPAAAATESKAKPAKTAAKPAAKTSSKTSSKATAKDGPKIKGTLSEAGSKTAAKTKAKGTKAKAKGTAAKAAAGPATAVEKAPAEPAIPTAPATPPARPIRIANLTAAHINDAWVHILQRVNAVISDYSTTHEVSMGSTVVALLLAGNHYYSLNVGDSRIYLLADAIYQLTHDHSLVQSEIDSGLLTEAQALVDPRRSVLLQAVGAGTRLEPDFLDGRVEPGSVFVLCSDGFRHTITVQEIWQRLNAGAVKDDTDMVQALTALTELNKQRNETDNISAIGIKVM